MFAITDLFFVEGNTARFGKWVLHEVELNETSSGKTPSGSRLTFFITSLELLDLVKKGVRLHFANQEEYENFKAIQLTTTRFHMDGLKDDKLIVIDQ